MEVQPESGSGGDFRWAEMDARLFWTTVSRFLVVLCTRTEYLLTLSFSYLIT